MKYLDWLAEHNGEDAIRKMVNDRWDLQCKLSIAEKKLAIAESGLAMVKALGGVGIPDGASDYQLGTVTGFEQAADIASKTITEIEAIEEVKG